MNAVAENAKTHEAMKRKAVSFRPDIEGLRGIAVLLVVAFHAHIQLWRGGFLGVDIFFVLSGYLITALLLQELESSGTLNLVGFYARRARRLLPAAAVVVVFVVVAGIFLLSPIEQIRYSKTALATTLYSSNLWFIHQSSDYFAADTANNPCSTHGPWRWKSSSTSCGPSWCGSAFVCPDRAADFASSLQAFQVCPSWPAYG